MISEKSNIVNHDNIPTEEKGVGSFKVCEQIGNTGKEGTVYLVKCDDGNEYAMKKFKKNKSIKNIEKEFELQKQAYKSNICPKAIDMNLVEKYILMEKMDSHLIDSMKKKNGYLTRKQQEDLVKIYKKLDDTGVFHGDSNILNYMYKDRRLHIIDFGMSSPIDKKLIKKLGTNKPNFTLMTLGMVIKLKELNCPPDSYSYLVSQITEENRLKYNL